MHCAWRSGRLRVRPYATIAAPSNLPTETSVALNPTSVRRTAYQLRAGVILSRPPQITRDSTTFERAFLLYQRRLNERLALPFTKYFYFKKGTPADLDWKERTQVKLTPAHDVGNYHSYGKEGWHDEVLIGAPESEPDHQLEALFDDATPQRADSNEEEGGSNSPVTERPTSRYTAADVSREFKSLNRLLHRTLTLLVRDTHGRWTFPTDPLVGTESLRQVGAHPCTTCEILLIAV